jgi:hypothetical protein
VLVYSDENFRSVDLAHPMFGTMLFHSWHGLLSYHPLSALGPVALAALTMRRDLRLTERVWAGYALFAVLAQLYLQASWWLWWNGMGTFGNRTVVLGSVVGALALARWLFLLNQSATRRSRVLAFVLHGFTLVACLWSFLLFLQGQSNHLTWGQLLQAQRETLLQSSVIVPMVVAILLSLGFGALTFKRHLGNALVTASTGFVSSLAAQGLLTELVRSATSRLGIAGLAPVLLSLVSCAAFSLVVYLAKEREFLPRPLDLVRPLLAGTVLWIFVVGTWGFSKLAVATEAEIAHPTAEIGNYRYRSTLVIDDLLECVNEYNLVQGFEERKRSSRHFIEATVNAGLLK